MILKLMVNRRHVHIPEWCEMTGLKQNGEWSVEGEPFCLIPCNQLAFSSALWLPAAKTNTIGPISRETLLALLCYLSEENHLKRQQWAEPFNQRFSLKTYPLT